MRRLLLQSGALAVAFSNFTALAKDPSDRGPAASSAQRLVTGDLTHLHSTVAGSAATLKMYITPSGPTGTATVYPAGTLISGQTMSAPNGGFASVWEVQIENWDPDGDSSPILKTYDIKVDANSFLGANASPPNPGCDLIHPYSQIACQKTCSGGVNNGGNCTTNGNCPGGTCTDPCPALVGHGIDSKCGATVPGKCQWIFADSSRPDWMFAGWAPFDYMFFQDPTSTSGPRLAGEAGVTQGVVDEHRRYYGGTLLLGVPACAQGSYQIELLAAQTRAIEFTSPPPPEIPISALISGTLNIGQAVAPTSRYLAYFPNAHNAGIGALQVELVELMRPSPPNLPQFPAPDFSALEGQYRYAGVPSTCVESDVHGTTIQCAKLQCSAEYRDWNTALGNSGLFIYGTEVVPSSRYNLRFLPASCQGSEPACPDASSPKSYVMRRLGDIVPPFQDPNPSAPVTQPDTRDIVAVLDKFRGVDWGPMLIQADLDPGLPNNIVDIADVVATEQAFRGHEYVYPGPTSCP